MFSTDREQLQRLLRLSGGLIAAMDGLWFLAVEEEFGNHDAIRLDRIVWERYLHVLVKRMRNVLGVTPDGVKGIRKIIETDPLFLTNDYAISEPSSNTMLLVVNRCSVLEAMERAGRKKYVCESTTGLYFKHLAREIDPNIIVRPLRLPPRRSHEDLCCKWLFELQSYER